MALVTTGKHPKALWPGLAQHFGEAYDEFLKDMTLYENIFQYASPEHELRDWLRMENEMLRAEIDGRK